MLKELLAEIGRVMDENATMKAEIDKWRKAVARIISSSPVGYQCKTCNQILFKNELMDYANKEIMRAKCSCGNMIIDIHDGTLNIVQNNTYKLYRLTVDEEVELTRIMGDITKTGPVTV